MTQVEVMTEGGMGKVGVGTRVGVSMVMGVVRGVQAEGAKVAQAVVVTGAQAVVKGQKLEEAVEVDWAIVKELQVQVEVVRKTQEVRAA